MKRVAVCERQPRLGAQVGRVLLEVGGVPHRTEPVDDGARLVERPTVRPDRRVKQRGAGEGSPCLLPLVDREARANMASASSQSPDATNA